MLTPDDINLDDFPKVTRVGTKEEGAITAVVNVTPEKPGGTTMVILVLWDGEEEPETIELPSPTIMLMK